MYKKEFLEEVGRIDLHPKETIEESLRGVEFDHFYTGKRSGGGIELHITSIVRDWDENVFIRKSWFKGSKKQWKSTIIKHIRSHLSDLHIGEMLVMRLMTNFNVSEENFREWDQYADVAMGE